MTFSPFVLESSFLVSAYEIGTDRAHKTPPVNMSAHRPSTDEERKGSPSFQDGSPPTPRLPKCCLASHSQGD